MEAEHLLAAAPVVAQRLMEAIEKHGEQLINLSDPNSAALKLSYKNYFTKMYVEVLCCFIFLSLQQKKKLNEDYL